MRYQELTLPNIIRLVESYLAEAFDPDTFLQRLRNVVTLAQRGATEGERTASSLALDRMKNRAAQEMKTMPANERSRFQHRLDAALAGGDDDDDISPPQRYDFTPRPKSRWRVGQSVVHIETGEIGRIFDIKAGTPPSYDMEWFTVPSDGLPPRSWEAETSLRDLTVADTERIIARNKAQRTREREAIPKLQS